MRAVDTDVLIRIITGDEPAQAAEAERFIANGAWVSPLVLAEATWVLAYIYKRTSQQIRLAIEILLEHRKLTIQNPEVVLIALSAFRSKPSLGFSDCLILASARHAGHVPLGTFDRTLGRLEAARVSNPTTYVCKNRM